MLVGDHGRLMDGWIVITSYICISERSINFALILPLISCVNCMFFLHQAAVWFHGQHGVPLDVDQQHGHSRHDAADSSRCAQGDQGGKQDEEIV